ncbi:SHOCT domain-containing protein [Nocardioides bizhenqiangii]|uniref:SHOCT domain-containing protein n=1 Tax=Nocardioides bizhenqiangii TaxID=3095076 RepID=A0ABZ0ZUP0_9ACTN|nr:SHOCT domain-containing protein [Nocardioides sp. HM61]WQQ28030.1 SHOCT domain-containing protein [Nocardioides sp. HM61]
MDDFGLWDVFVSMIWFMLLLAWFSLLIRVLADVFRDRTLGGAAKAMWTLLIVVIPWLGVLLYIVVRGDSMNERNHQAFLENQERMRAYMGSSAGANVSDELRGLTELRDSGVLTPEEYEQAKAKILA